MLFQQQNNKGTQLEDEELLRQFRITGNMQALATLYLRYMELVYAVCYKYLKTPQQAQDAVMSIYETLVKKLPDHEVSNFRGWLYMLAKNHCLMLLRSPASRIRILDIADMQLGSDLHLDDVMDKEAKLDRLSACIETLPDEQRSAVSLFYLQEKSYKEIEASTGIPWNKVRSHIQNGRRNLKICMDQKQAADQ